MRILHCIVADVAYYLHKMLAVGIHPKVVGNNLNVDVNLFFRLHALFFRYLGKSILQVNSFLMEYEGLSALHARGKNLLYHTAKFMQLFERHLQIVFACLAVEVVGKLQQCVVGGVSHRHGGL